MLNSGAPWVKPEQAMQNLVFSAVEIKGPKSYSAVLPLPIIGDKQPDDANVHTVDCPPGFIGERKC